MLRLPPPIWTMIFLALTAGVSWMLGWPQIGWPPQHIAVGTAIFFAGWVTPVWAFRVFRSEGTEVDPMSETNRVLVVRGPYRLTRNPMYLGLTIAALGMAIVVGSWPMLAAPVAVFLTANFVHIPFEEAKMRRQFGEAYDAYCARVRRWI
ncbi:MAG TPA: isoprenylcysteine carboxylmethyltransferase family protein [Caulobacteraceae bacterium]|nr:isoprenylcysteine carboxylmethyltransferase family protein [Caulobacteraceae bacterium]